MKKYRLSMLIAMMALLMALSGCTPALRTSIDFTDQTKAESQVEFEPDDSAMPSTAASASVAPPSEPEQHQWSYEKGLILRKGRVFTKDSYLGDFRAELEVEIIYTDPEAVDFEGFILGLGFKENPEIGDDIVNIFRALQFYGNHVCLTDSIKAYSVMPHMPYESLLSLIDADTANYILPFEIGFMPGLVIGNGADVSGLNRIVVERTGGTISVWVNGTLVGSYESQFKVYDPENPELELLNLLFDDFDVDRPIRVGVFSACAHIEKTDDSIEEGVFIRKLTVYADEVIEHN
ncbi:MAG TPA: hypothetical protein PLT03_00580 [Bacillota bacterium]|nr:hypothetical protein [Bacillota bacterium]HOA15808.1 hypothetical protein [Bacillota bacterium]HOG52348.1 hypothetical protein [Bacillota bacterium]